MTLANTKRLKDRRGGFLRRIGENRTTRSAITAAVAFVASACAEPGADQMQSSGAVATSAELKIGDHGPAVRRVYDYLHAYGYLPNDDLAKSDPRFRPLVLENPADPEEFDEVIERAVKGLQGFNGLPATGVIDAETQKVLGTSRCGLPEHWPASDEKFALPFDNAGHPMTWGGFCSPKYTSSGVELTFTILGGPANFQQVFRQALQNWSGVTSFKFKEGGSNSCIRMLIPRQYKSTEDPSNLNIGLTLSPTSNTGSLLNTSDILIGTKHANGSPITWNVDGGTEDLLETYSHEIGHALLLDHSNVSSTYHAVGEPGHPEVPLMYPPAHQPWTVTADDLVGVHLRGMTLFPNGQTGIAADVGSTTGTYWHAGMDQSLHCNGALVRGFAVALSVMGDRLFHVGQDSKLYSNTSGCDDNWFAFGEPEPLKDVAAAPGQLFVLGKTGHVWRLVSTGRWTDLSMGLGSPATKIAADMDNQVWAIDSTGIVQIFQAGWIERRSPDAPNRPYFTIHGGKDGHMWVVGNDGFPYVWNHQTSIPGAPARDKWQRMFEDRGRNSGVNIREHDMFTGVGGVVFAIASSPLYSLSLGF